ncbi:MAG: glutamine--fructose-6-phosphate transaminase (isomerizing), partial [Candidatus Marinimicrobia bacterium]|nr:glutamine--fructose-6-phosphate transaminase (isomerizing) [Candidatus Neomarinimicrobiota bacterium]
AAFIDQTNNIIYLADGEISVVSANSIDTYNIDSESVDKEISELSMSLEEIEKGGYEHFMLKEIHEQPKTIMDAIRGRLIASEGISHLGGIDNVVGRILWSRDISITACGTSWHAALIGQYLIESFVNKPVKVDYASEFRYRHSLVNPESVVMVISQSGETADTLAALKLAKEKGALTIGIVNAVGSTIARETDAGVYVHAGPEIGVASTKAFTSQVSVLALIALKLGRMLGTISLEDGQRKVRALNNLQSNVKRILENEGLIKEIAFKYKDHRNFLYLGRGFQFPVALEGALKLKEISYIHAEGYPAAEMKHGPIALIDENMPVVVIATQDKTYDKIMSNIQEVRARKGSVIAIANEGDENIKNFADYVFYIPKTEEFIQPILSVIPLQLLSYYIAVYRGCNVDQPRNLAKSVTVE